VEEKGQEAERRCVRNTCRHRHHPDGGPKSDDWKPSRSARKKRRVSHTRTKQRRAYWRVGTTRRSPATDKTWSSDDRGGRRRRTRLGGARVSQDRARKSRSSFQNLKKKGGRMGQKNPADDTNARPIPQRRQLEMRNPAKQKKTNK
jgi:hypothetical protein